jgi:serpin B
MKPLLCFLSCLFPLFVSASNFQNIIDGNNKFAFKLYHKVKVSTNENLFYSPFSISTALAMVYTGARSKTAQQISRTMNFRPDKDFHSNFKRLLDNLNEGTEMKIKLNIANGLWAQKDFKFINSYFDIVKTKYNSALKNVDFIDGIEREKTRKDINTWLEQKTNDKIKDLLGQGDLSSLTRLVLINAVYFYADWAEPFKKESTQPKEFSLIDKSKITVPFMNQQDRYRYFKDSTLQAIEIPYKDNKASMVIFLPTTNSGIAEFEKSLDFKYYHYIIRFLQPTEVRLSLPKFQTTYKINLGSTLSQMGMPLAFSPSGADFSGMTGKRDLCIFKVIHQAFINVDKKGKSY